MEHTVTLTSCKQRFVVQETETILEAAIRAGISLGYGCSSGTCGLCKARVVNGRVKEIKSREFAMPESEKLQGNILTCINTACENLELDVAIAHSVEDIAVQELKVKVRKLELVANDIYRLIVQTPRTNRLRFLAGQFAELTLDHFGCGNFAIASCPCEDRLIEFHIRVLEKNSFARTMTEKLRVGDSLNLRGPFGSFVYDETSIRSVLLFAFDTGFAAIKSLLEHITAQEKEVLIHLIWMSCSQDGLYLNNLCRSWDDAFDFFTYDGIAFDASLKQMITNPEQGRATVEAHLAEALNDYDNLGQYDIYISAPEQATTIMRNICLQKRASETRIFSEPVRGNEDMSCIGSLTKN